MDKNLKVWFVLKLTLLFSFFIFTFSSFILKYLTELNEYLQNTNFTILNNLISNSVTSWVFLGIKYLSIFFIIGCLISFVLLFYFEVIKKRLVN